MNVIGVILISLKYRVSCGCGDDPEVRFLDSGKQREARLYKNAMPFSNTSVDYLRDCAERALWGKNNP
jgi:hypothetical protein